MKTCQIYPKSTVASPSITVRVKTPCGTGFFVVTYNEETGQILTVECNLGKNGDCARASMDVSTRNISRALKLGDSPLEIATDMIGVTCHRPPAFDPDMKKLVYSCHEGLGYALKEVVAMIEDMLSSQTNSLKEIA